MKEYQKICETCDNVFYARSNRALYCSDKCKMKAFRRRHAVTAEKDFVTVKDNETGAKKVLFTSKITTCDHCGKRFSYGKRKPLYCSDSCKTMANRAKQNSTAKESAYQLSKTFSEAWLDCYQMGWKAAYARLESMELIYMPGHQRWVLKSQKALFD